MKQVVFITDHVHVLALVRPIMTNAKVHSAGSTQYKQMHVMSLLVLVELLNSARL